MTPSRNHYDVAIIGAGPAGATAAIAHAHRGARVLLVDANPNAASRLAGEWLHPPGVSVLKTLGLLPIEAAAAHGEGRGMVVFPDDGEEPIRLPYPDGAVGLSCDHRAFVDTLRARADALEDVEYVPGVRVLQIGANRLELSRGGGSTTTVSAGLIVGADGRRSISRTHLGLADGSTPLSHMAGVELRDVELPFEGFGHVILGGPGPILLYRIGPDRARACLDIPIERCPRRRDAALLWRTFRPVFPESLLPAFREALLARRVVWTTTQFRPRSNYGRGNVALIGDAVGYYHPLTAVGMTLGLQDALALADAGNVDEYRRQRERQSYVAELLSNALYHVMSHEDASIETIRTATYRMWGDSDQERRRTMRILISADLRSASFAAAFLKVAVGALKHLVWNNPQEDWRRLFPALADVFSDPVRMFPWPAALLIGHVIRTLTHTAGTSQQPIPKLRLVWPSPRDGSPDASAPNTPRPSEIDARVGLASAFSALADSLQEVPVSPGAAVDPEAVETWPRIVESVSRTRSYLDDGPDISGALRLHRRGLGESATSLALERATGTSRWLAEAALALVDRTSGSAPPDGLQATVEALLQIQRPSGGFASGGPATPRRWLGLLRRGGKGADLPATALGCRALAAVRRHHPGLLVDRVPMALARARTWLLERQSALGFWPTNDGRASVLYTADAMEALSLGGTSPASRSLRRAGRWLRQRQAADGSWKEAGLSGSALTARVVSALITARPPEVDAIERGVNALLEPTAWNAGTNPAIRDLCLLAEGLAAFLDWSHDVPGATPAAHETASAADA